MLTALNRENDYVHKCKNGSVLRKRKWRCKCECGKEKIVFEDSLKSGDTKSCGCYVSSRLSEVNRKYNTYDLLGEYGVGFTSKGEEFYFDIEDYEKIKDYYWLIDSRGYVVSVTKGKEIKMHNLVLNISDDKNLIDHIYHKPNDNRKSQLREVDKSQNGMNRCINKNNTTGKKGVSFDKNKQKFVARIQVRKKSIYLGAFNSFEEAANARDEADKKYFGEYAYEEE